jgi:cyclopropane fatty-acyl-phospholipid synthase-like methyltransferase
MTVNQQLQDPPAATPVIDKPIELQAKDNLVSSYLRLFREFRRHDLNDFCDQHEKLYREALSNNDHLTVTKHYYGLMSDVIETYYGDGWHFCAPEFAGQTRAEATSRMYDQVADELQLETGDHALDLGCGVGGMLRYVARRTGARISGVTLGENEVEEANRLIGAEGLQELCQVVQGDCQAMQFDASTFDGVFAVYSLKYYPDLNRVFSEIQRVLKPGGKFVAYCLCKSKIYDEDQPQHRQLLNDFQYSTAMPSLHTVPSMIAAAADNGLTCVGDEDLSNGELNWYSYWVRNPLLPWLVKSRIVYGLARSAEAVRILPRGFARFNDTFLAGTLRHIIRGGQTGVLTGSALLTFKKKIR